jgi:hypothetical protein
MSATNSNAGPGRYRRRRAFQLLLPCGHAGRLDGSFSRHKSAPPRYIGYGMSTSTRARDRRNEIMPEVPRARDALLMQTVPPRLAA